MDSDDEGWEGDRFRQKGKLSDRIRVGKQWVYKESESHSVVSSSLRPHVIYNPWNSRGQNTGVGSLSFLHNPRIFPTQGLKPDLPHSRWIFYQLSHQGSPRIGRMGTEKMEIVSREKKGRWHQRLGLSTR